MSAPVAANSGFDRRDVSIVAALLVSSRLLYWWLGLHFDASTLHGYMQFIDVELLQNRLLESLWYYHANPPLLNLFTGVGLKLFGAHADAFFSVVFHLIGLLLALCVYALTLRLSSARPAAIVATGLMVFSPSFVLYENWLMYSFPAAALLTFSSWVLYRYARGGETKWCLVFFGTLATLLLTRSLFHLAWMILVVVLLLICLRERWRQVLLAAAVPVLVVALWYGKNYYYFGTFSSSTWLGLGLSNISTLVATREELQPLVDDGRLTPFALVSRYTQVDALFASPPRPPTGIAVLDQVKKSTGADNFNNRRLIDINRYYTHDALTVIRTYPFSYVVGLSISNRLFFSPSSMSQYFSAANRAAVAPMERLFVPLLYATGPTPRWYWQPHFGLGTALLHENISVALILTWLTVLCYGYARARRGLLSKDRQQRPDAVVIGFIVVSMLYVYAVGTALELAENYRYRFLVEPLFFALTATAATSLVRAVKGKLNTWQSRQSPGEIS